MADCGAVLAAKSIYKASSDRSTKISILKLVNEEQYNKESEGFDLLIPTKFGKIGGNWNKFNDARNSYLNSVNIQFDSQESVSILQIDPAEGAIEAWRACMLQNDRNLMATLIEQDDETATFKIEWHDSGGLGQLKKCQLIPSIGTIVSDSGFQNNPSFSGVAHVTLARGGKNRRVSFTATGKAGVDDTQFEALLKISAPIPPRAKSLITEETPISIVGKTSLDAKISFNQTARIYGYAVVAYRDSGNPTGYCDMTINGEQIVGERVGLQLPHAEVSYYAKSPLTGTQVGNWNISKRMEAGETLTVVCELGGQNGQPVGGWLFIEYQDYE